MGTPPSRLAVAPVGTGHPLGPAGPRGWRPAKRYTYKEGVNHAVFSRIFSKLKISEAVFSDSPGVESVQNQELYIV